MAEHLTLAYASTVHAAQRRTVHTSHALLDEVAAREAAYVALSRGRDTNTAYLVALRDSDDVEAEQTVEMDADREAVDEPERIAEALLPAKPELDREPEAERVAETGQERTVDEPTAEPVVALDDVELEEQLAAASAEPVAQDARDVDMEGQRFRSRPRKPSAHPRLSRTSSNWRCSTSSPASRTRSGQHRCVPRPTPRRSRRRRSGSSRRNVLGRPWPRRVGPPRLPSSGGSPGRPSPRRERQFGPASSSTGTPQRPSGSAATRPSVRSSSSGGLSRTARPSGTAVPTRASTTGRASTTDRRSGLPARRVRVNPVVQPVRRRSRSAAMCRSISRIPARHRSLAMICSRGP